MGAYNDHGTCYFQLPLNTLFVSGYRGRIPIRSLGSKLATAVINGERAEAWYEIRYNSNGGSTGIKIEKGIANRRYAESDLFGLYEDAPLTQEEAESIFRMYTEHRRSIAAYEADFPPHTTIHPGGAVHTTFVEESAAARELLVGKFAQFAGAPSVIDGELLIGSDDALKSDLFDEAIAQGRKKVAILDLNRDDLMLGQAGNDILRGHGGQDVLYRGEGDDTISGGDENDFLFGDGGNDTLQGGDGDDTIQGNEGVDRIFGGTGDDLLKGGAGNDIYLWNSGDGHDQIEDTEGKNVILVR